MFGREWHDLRMKRLGSKGFALLSVGLQYMVAIRASEANSLDDGIAGGIDATNSRRPSRFTSTGFETESYWVHRPA
jgi:hypothetical protein